VIAELRDAAIHFSPSVAIEGVFELFLEEAPSVNNATETPTTDKTTEKYFALVSKGRT